MNKAGEDGINRGRYPFIYFDPNDLNCQKNLHIYCKRTIKTFHSKIEQLSHELRNYLYNAIRRNVDG